jgi:putative transposase
MWREKKHIDFKATYREFYEKYKPLIGAVTTQTIIRKNNGAWRSFFRLSELRREGRLPPFMTKVNPPGFGKRNGSRTLWTVIRKDQYKMDGDRIILQGLGAIGWIEVKFKGPVYLRGERGELMIRYDDDKGKWYASIAFEVSEKAVRGGMDEGAVAAEGQLNGGNRYWDQQFNGHLYRGWLNEAHQRQTIEGDLILLEEEDCQVPIDVKRVRLGDV